MNKILKMVLILIGIGVIGFGIFTYFSFEGTPWLKIYYKYQIKDYLADKYEEKMVITKGLYNFKDGTYGVQAHREDQPELTFSAWQHYDKTKKYRDYYPEALWHQQINAEFKADLDEIYPTAVRKEFHGVMGISDELNISSDIPHYKEVDTFFVLVINEEKKLTEEIKENEVNKLYDLLEILKGEDVAIDVTIIFIDQADDTKNSEKYINTNMKDNRIYPTKEEIEKIFDLEMKRDAHN